MSTLLLSLLLLVLVALGLVVVPAKTVERFADAINPTPTAVSQQFVSPTLKNLLATPDVSVQPVTVDPLTRELDIIEVTAYPVTLIETAADDDDSKPTKCPICPDMSQYIRMDEIPCWNCTLP